jgi:uncharacterized iron-regulated membrane protein
MTARRLLTLLHAWLGALAAVFVVLVAGSGAALAFMSEMFEAQYGAVLEAEAPRADAPYADLDRVLAAAQAGSRADLGKSFAPLGVLMPHSRVEGIETALPFGIPEGGAGFEDTWMFSVDPWTGAYQGQFRLDDAFGHKLVHFHHDLFVGPVGVTLVSALGLLLAAFALTGLWLWWPRNGSAWSKARRLELGGGPRRALFNLHAWAGVWAALAIVLFSLTGAATAKPDWFGPLLAGAPAAPPASAGFDRRCAGVVTPGQAARAAEAAHPGHRLAMLYFGAGPDQPYRLSLKSGRDLDRMGGDLIVFAHPSCPGVTWSDDVARGTLAERAGQMMFSLHGGYSFGPWLGDLLVVLSGLSLLLLAGSGLYVFFTRTLRFPARRPRQPVIQSAPAPAE